MFVYIPEHPMPECIYVLRTNYLVSTNCALPTRCGYVHYKQLSSTWYGEEIGLCIGIGSVLPYATVFDDANFESRFHLPNNNWFAVYNVVMPHTQTVVWRNEFDTPEFCSSTVELLNEPLNMVFTDSQLVMLTSLDKILIVPKSFVSNFITLGTSATDVFPNIDKIVEANGKFCSPIIYRNAIEKMYDTKRPIQQQLASYPMLYRFPPIHVDECALNVRSIPQLNSSMKVFPKSATECQTLSIGNVVDTINCTLLNTFLTCSPLTETTSYSVPGTTYIINAVQFVIAHLYYLIIDTFGWVVNEFHLVFYATNERLRIVEYLLITIPLTLKYPSIYTPLLSLIMIALTLGITRTIEFDG